MNETNPTESNHPRGLREARQRRGLTQEQLAAELGVQQGYISRLECGHNSPGPMFRHFLALYLGTTPEIVGAWFAAPAENGKAA